MFKCRHYLQRKGNVWTPKSMRKHQSRELGVLLKRATCLVASAHLDDLQWNPLQTSQLHRVEQNSHSCVVSPPQELWGPQTTMSSSTSSSSSTHSVDSIFTVVLNFLKYECCFLTSEIFFNSLPYTHTHTHTHRSFFTYLIQYHFLRNSRINGPQGTVLCRLSSSASIQEQVEQRKEDQRPSRCQATVFTWWKLTMAQDSKGLSSRPSDPSLLE